ncbi:carboxypeptidase-like regulatory domain-containing protein [Nocardioides carbamazepini]|uniref:carboxypeptidase-like regulatory domain-containing protein n=1 Tax=Nocardioides carbamazepini TaxID=2854259 RepID=UPI00214A4B94|nr:carboxypeptidase-like regulatory domain-containing protein [Nocardioides carbamazepini]MCR1782730.1 carboxypeptidase-like regulatory domain-containing protein [Nocardioides carbamazepini]
MSMPPIEPPLPPGVLVPELVRTAAGTAATLTAVVTNTVGEPRSYTLMTVGVDPSWLPGPIRTGVVAPGASETLEVRLTPTAGTLPARYPVAVTVQALIPGTNRPAPEPTAIGEVTLVVNPRAQFQLEVTPERSSLIRRQRLSVVLRNGSTVDTTTELQGSATPGLEVRLKRQVVTIAAGEEVQVPGRLIVTRPRPFGGTSQHSWTVTATTAEVVRRARGIAQQRAVLGTAWLRAAALLAVVGVWITAAVVFIPPLADRFGSDPEDSAVAGSAGDGAQGDGGSGEDGSDAAGGSGSGGKGRVKVVRAESPATPKGLQLNGTVSAEDPSGVTVTLAPTSLVDEEAVGASDAVRPAAYGKTPQSAVLLQVPGEVPRPRTATTTEDGTWSFPDVTSPGYYLVTFSKPGYDPQSFVVDAATADPTKPMEVDLQPGDGNLSGTVRGPDGPVGAATVTISDGTSTLTTSSASRKKVGGWSVSGLHTPGSYLVQVTSFGLGTESRLVTLDAGGTATADVRLVPGVAALTGTVEGLESGGDLGGIGGVTVTATDEQGVQRVATTVTTQELAGRYQLPDLPAPGTYIVTFSADGYQDQTSRVDLRRGQSRAKLDAELVLSSGVVAGVVSEIPSGDRVVGAGMTLSNAEFAYKTTTTADNAAPGQQAGAFRFNGVEPGTYQLTTEYFEFGPHVLTVQVRAGQTVTVSPEIERLPGGVLPATSTIRGGAVDLYSGDPIDCTAADPCHATTTDQNGDEITVPFAGDEEYILPATGGPGLEPGLYSVLVSAPGYESAIVRVQLPLGTTAIAPTAELTKLPVISGTLRVASGVPATDNRTCIWASPDGDPQPTASCAAAIADGSCLAPGEPRGILDEATTVCEWVEDLDPYELEVPRAGPWLMTARMTDGTYAPLTGVRVNLAPGSTTIQNLEFIRLAEIQVIPQALDGTGAIQPFGGADVTIAPILTGGGTGPATSGTYGADGRVHFTSLAPGGYRLTASATGRRTDTGDVYVLDNQVAVVYLTLGRSPGLFTAQVVTDGNQQVDGARVEITAPGSYDGSTPQHVTATATSDTGDGCVAFHDPATAVVAQGACDATYSATALTEADFASDYAQRIRVTKTGYEELVVTDKKMQSVMTLNLAPSPVAFSSRITTEGTAPSYPDVTFAVTSTTTPVGTVTVTANGSGDLQWEDSRYAAGSIRPGTYTLTATKGDYVSDPVTFTCQVATPCAPDGPVLRQLGTLRVEALGLDQAGSPQPADNVIVTLLRGTQPVSTKTSPTDGNAVTFTDLRPGPTDYTVRVQAAGYAFGSGTLSCTVGADPAVSSQITIVPGTQTACDATLDPMARIDGAVEGVLAAAPVTDPDVDVRSLAGAGVTATRCIDWLPAGPAAQADYCTALGSVRFPATTGADGRFSLSGTNQVEGIADGVWLLTAQQPGWRTVKPGSAPSAALAGTVVRVVDGVDATTTVRLHVIPVDFTVDVKDQNQTALTGATVQLLRGTTTVATAAAVGGTAGRYRFTDAIPGNYTLQVSGSGVVVSTAQVEIKTGLSGQTFAMAVSRAANSLSGTVTSVDAQSGLSGVTVTLHACTGGTCASTVASGTDGLPLQTTTAANGTFLFRTVPNGSYQARFQKRKYEDLVGDSYTFDHTVGALPTFQVTMVRVLRAARVDLVTSPSGTALTGATVLLRSTETGVAPLGPQTVSGTSVSFAQVPYGCWNIELTLPSGHFGQVNLPGKDSLANDCQGHVVVRTNGAEISASVTVVETPVTITVAGTPIAGHSAPASATVAISGLTLPDDQVVVGSTGGLVVHLPPGSHTITASAQPSTFWPSVSQSVSITAGDAARSVALTLTEGTGALVVRTRLDGTSTAVAGTITIAPGTGQSASVPAAYATGVATTGELGLDLPAGKWHVTATTTDGRTVTEQDVSVAAATQSVTLNLPLPPTTP